MKPTLAFLFFLSNICLSAQDTIFILKDRNPYFYHTIFIDPDKDSKYYPRIADFKFNKSDVREYAESIRALKEHDPTPFPRHNFGKLPKQWCMLFSYQNQFYVYSPSDYLYNYKVAISDSTFIDYPGDGVLANRIQSFEQKNTKTYHFKLVNYKNQERPLIIHWIDPKRGIAIFEYLNAPLRDRYQLMVQADKVKNFPVIVNYCATDKQEEFEGFDQVDFKKWLEKK